ncbi:MAG: hypothetical protein ACOY93_05380 [Bacillota bacterium]
MLAVAVNRQQVAEDQAQVIGLARCADEGLGELVDGGDPFIRGAV